MDAVLGGADTFSHCRSQKIAPAEELRWKPEKKMDFQMIKVGVDKCFIIKHESTILVKVSPISWRCAVP
jgi:hypothetical protein